MIDGQMELEAKQSAHRGAAPLGQPSEHLVPPDPCVVTDDQLGVIDKVDSGFLATVTMEQEVKGQQESRHQGHKPAGAEEISKAVAQPLLQAVAPEMLEVLVGGELGRWR